MKEETYIMLLKTTIRYTRLLLEIYKTDELREYLKYLETLRNVEFFRPPKDYKPSKDECVVAKIII